MDNTVVCESNEPEKNCNYIVGIGASAGGLEAVQDLLSALPVNTGFPFILVQHLSPDYKSLLCEILSRHTKMPVIQVEDNMKVEPNTVYVIQPGRNLEILNGTLHLSAQKEHELNLPIDLFFRSLAKEAGPHAIGIVLSGTGSDGSNGLKAIKENEGMTLVQDFDTAKFDGMPKNAMRTGIVDAQMSPEMIAAEIAHIAATCLMMDINSHATHNDDIDEELIKKVYVILKKVCNVNFSHYKSATIIRRMERRMMLTHKEELSEYVNYLYENPEEAKTLSKEILIGVTSFFRDPDYFQTLQEKAIRKLLLESKPEEQIRVWVAGCSTGEEAYSIAILFCEEMEVLELTRNIKIFATDIDASSIETASKGIYSESIIDAVSLPWLSKYFTPQNGSYMVKRELRKRIIFSVHNVFQDPPFGRLDLISCRNMMIYFQPVLQSDLFDIFHIALKDKGYLFLGKSEAVGSYTDAFPVVDAVAKLFSHNASVQYPSAKNIPFLQSSYLDEDYDELSVDHFSSRNSIAERIPKGDADIDTLVLEQFLPGCLVVDERNNIIHTYGDCSNYVHIPIGKYSDCLFDLLTDALKVPVSTILKEARDQKQKVQYKDISFSGEKKNETICLTALPIDKSEGNLVGLCALLFLGVEQIGVSDDAIPYQIDRVAAQRIVDLEQFLGETQEKLERSVAEQECVNEELQSANEELLTANEELQSSNEELQSVNEELYTVNSEYQAKMIELSNLNDDIANFLSSTLIGIIFVDKDLCVRRFTDYVSTEFTMMSHDIGRPINSIAYNFPSVDIPAICQNVLKTLLPDDRDIVTDSGKNFFMRVAPYRSLENTILGCVITLVDVTAQKQGLVLLHNAEAKLDDEQKKNAEKDSRVTLVVDECTISIDSITEGLSNMRLLKKDDPAFDKQIDEVTERVLHLKKLVATLTTSFSEAKQ